MVHKDLRQGGTVLARKLLYQPAIVLITCYSIDAVDQLDWATAETADFINQEKRI